MALSRSRWWTSCPSGSRASSLASSASFLALSLDGLPFSWNHLLTLCFHRSNQDIVNQAVLEVSDQMLYDIENNRAPYKHGPLDPRLVSSASFASILVFVLVPGQDAQLTRFQGTSSKIGKCATCMQPLQLCTGHFGHIRLPLPVFHIGYLRFIQMILQNICKVRY